MSAQATTGATLKYSPFAGSAAFVEVAAGRRTFGPADRGPHVKALELALVAAGYGLPGGAVPDVAFTAGTKSTLARFQRDKGLAQSGVLDKATLEALDAALAAKEPARGQKPDTVKLMNDLIAQAKEGDSLAGTRIAREEIERALEALKLDDGAISANEYAAAVQAVTSEAFQKVATPEAKAFAVEFLRKHAASAGGAGADGSLKIRKLDPAARDAALGKSRLTAEIQAAEVKVAAGPAAAGATGPDGLADLARRAFGRGSLAVQPFAAASPAEVGARLARGVAGYSRPAPAEVADVAARLAAIAGRGGRLLAADWSRGREEQGTYVAAVSAGGDEALLIDVFRQG